VIARGAPPPANRNLSAEEGAGAAATDSNRRTPRLAWIDQAKAIGIVLVVVGHVNRGLVSASLLPANGWHADLDRFIYAFHMPLFFVLGGYVAPRGVQRGVGPQLVRCLKTIAYPYFVWATIQQGLVLLLSRWTDSGASLGEIAQLPVQPVMQFWFLYTYFVLAAVFTVTASFAGTVGAAALLLVLYACGEWGLFGRGPWP